MAQMQIQPPQIDSLYQGYTKELYKITGEEGYDSIMDVMQADQGTGSSSSSGGGGGGSGGSLTVPAESIDSGSSVSTTVQAAGAASRQGKTKFDNTEAGYIIGVDQASGNAKFFIGNATNYLNWNGDTGTLTIVGGASVSSLDIPDTTTSASMHVDSSGNTWWGANVASGLSGANASISSAGAAVFKDVRIGGTAVQYVITNSGIFSFGDGSDGAGAADGSTALAGATLSGGNYTLTRDVYYTSLTISTGVTIFTGGYRIFGSVVLTLNGTAKIDRSGNAGGTGGTGSTPTHGGGGPTNIFGGTAGTAGAALADGYLKGAMAGAAGGAGGQGGAGNAGAGAGTGGTGGTAGGNTTNSLGFNGSVAGGGGGGGTDLLASGGAGASGGLGGTVTASNVKLIANWHLATLLDISSSGSTVKFDNSAGSGSGGGAGGGAGDSVNANGSAGGGGGGGGGSGSGGGIIAIYFKNIVIGASASIKAIGGAGGNGGNGGSALTGPDLRRAGGGGTGGGGAGGNGGIIVLAYNSLTNSGTISVAGGSAGVAGASVGSPATSGGSSGDPGTDGSAGSAGTIYQFQLSL